MFNKPLAAIGLCAILAVLGSSVAWSVPPPDCSGDSTQFARVNVTIEGDRIKVQPFSQTIYVDKDPKRVCWVVNNLAEGRTLHIVKKSSAKSVFPGKMIANPSTFTASGIPNLDLRPGDSYTWGYNLKVTETDKTLTLLFRDPEVIVVREKGRP